MHLYKLISTLAERTKLLQYLKKYSGGKTVLDSTDEEGNSEEESPAVKTKKLRKRLDKLAPKSGTKGQMSRVGRILEMDSLGRFLQPSSQRGTKRLLPDMLFESRESADRSTGGTSQAIGRSGNKGKITDKDFQLRSSGDEGGDKTSEEEEQD